MGLLAITDMAILHICWKSKGLYETRARIHMLTLETTRFSAVVKAFVEQFPAAEVKLDGKIPSGPLESWCTNKKLKAAINLSLVNNRIEILGFHDGPWNMWASDEALPLVKTLAEKKVLRFEQARYIQHDKRAAMRNTATHDMATGKR